MYRVTSAMAAVILSGSFSSSLPGSDTGYGRNGARLNPGAARPVPNVSRYDIGGRPWAVRVRIDQPDDPAVVSSTADVPGPHGVAGAEPPPRRREAPPEPADAATRAQRSREYQARVERGDAIDRAYERLREVEHSIVTPAMRRVEAEDPDRHLVGLDNRLK